VHRRVAAQDLAAKSLDAALGRGGAQPQEQEPAEALAMRLVGDGDRRFGGDRLERFRG